VARTRGFIINRFRGDKTLLDPGLVWLEDKTAKPVFGVLPYLLGLHLDAEDAIRTEQAAFSNGVSASVLKVIVPVTQRISNHTDFDALRAHPQVDLVFVGPGEPVPAADLIILAGTKATTTDLAGLRAAGWEAILQKHLRYGGKVIGICGGMQMLGTMLHDPHGSEGPPGSMPGLGLLDYETAFEREKQLGQVSGTLCLDGQPQVTGYEIHMGVTTGVALKQPSSTLADGRQDGAISPDGQVLATYLHGVFDHPEACSALLRWAGLADAQVLDLNALREASLERLADTLEQHLDMPSLLAEIR
jgi:adenosylcobyric acid synthase